MKQQTKYIEQNLHSQVGLSRTKR